MSFEKPLTFQQALKKNVKRILTYWAPLSVILGGLGTILGFYTISTYTTAIGRPDLMASAIEAKSALVLWLAIIALLVAAYFFVLMTTSVLFGCSVSLFNDSPNLQPDLVKLLILPVLLGIAALMVTIFKDIEITDCYKLMCIVVYGVLTILALQKSPTFRLAVDLCTTTALPGKSQSKAARVFFLVILACVLVSTVLSTVLPVSLILQAYSGEDTPEALTKLMLISIVFASMTLIPVIVFYDRKTDLFKRVSQCLAAAFVILVIIIGASPGGPLTIVYSAASLMSVRDQTSAQFLLTEEYAKEDLDTEVWGLVETLRKHPLVSAFPLFSFGDVLLLCPAKLIKTELKDWPIKSAYCVVTKNSKALRMPRKSEAAAEAKKLIETAPKSG
ncbi:hypothetical protein [Pseudomonas syringae]|uniref:hypothetical protein n=1 Tax=Pseudomonas syringae TaxID=317 RepID=UPI000403D94A|nr:hypothetical protein [Pseudomonas syringae]MBS7419292.1 hypothetical protein [Pseudomonas syringae]NAO52180.1 hypothetical protein [Pseudomonas syringae]UOF18888.1 hypothetical protein N023_19935 [Pseudomonas syringae CC440]UZA81268.1 hypothetical protein EZZ79_20785 [Pseudomonas syringae]